jgi:class 3 adenylate cyclase/TolB-like protein
MSETRKLAAILVADIVGYSRLAGADEDRTLARLRGLRSDLIDPAIAAHRGRIVKRTGDGSIIEFRSVIDAVRCGIEVQSGLIERNAGVPPEKRIEFRVGIHVGDVVEESDGDLMGDGVNIAARLEGVANPGAICLSEDAYRHVKGRLELTVTDLGQTRLKNIAEPVRVYSLEVGKPATGPAAAEGALPAWRRRRTKSLRLSAVAAVIAAALVVAAWFGWRKFTPPLAPAPPPAATAADEKLTHAPRLSTVVLPFADLSGDPVEDRFADGLTDDVTTALSLSPQSFVISRSTASAYKDKPIDVKQLGRDLGVRYVLEGSVRRVADTITTTAQLISTETGAHIWADRFEGERGKTAELQFEAQARIANAVDVELIRAENQRALRERPTRPDAQDLTLRGWAAFNSGYTPENLNKAVAYFEQALSLEPDNPWALEGSALAQVSRLTTFGIENGRGYDVLVEAEGKVDRVLAVEPNSHLAHFIKALIALGNGEPDASLAELNAAVAANRNFADALAEKGHFLIVHGRSTEGVDLTEQALRLDPRDPARGLWQYYLCDAYAHLAEWERVVEACQKSAAMSPALGWPYFGLVAAYGWLGRLDEARDAIAELKQRWPFASVQFYNRIPGVISEPKFKSELQRILDGLRKAGLREM